MVEYTENLNDGFLYVQSSIAPGANVIYRGDDVKEGQLLMKQGQVIRPQEVGALAALGVPLAPVYERLRVGILSTGDELVEVSAPQTGSVVRDVNTYALSAGLSAIGAEPVRYGITKDDHASLTAALSIALRECDAVLISGGSSVGTADMTRRIIDEAGRPGVFLHGVAVKPGKPTIVGDIGGKPVFGLPGHPVSAYFIFRIFAAPILQRMMGVIREQPREAFAIMGRNVPSNHGRQEYLPVALTEEDGPESCSAGSQQKRAHHHPGGSRRICLHSTGRRGPHAGPARHRHPILGGIFLELHLSNQRIPRGSPNLLP